MNALFGTTIKFFLALVQADDTVGQDDGDGAQSGDRFGFLQRCSGPCSEDFCTVCDRFAWHLWYPKP